jgi:hypothetical protein
LTQIAVYQRSETPSPTGPVAKAPYSLADKSGMISAGKEAESFGGGLMTKIIAAQVDTDKSNAEVLSMNKYAEQEKWLQQNPDKAFDESQNLTHFNSEYNDEVKNQWIDSAKTPDGKRLAGQIFDQSKAQHAVHYQNQANVIAIKGMEAHSSAVLENYRNAGAASLSDNDNMANVSKGLEQLKTDGTHKLNNRQDPEVLKADTHDFIVAARSPFIEAQASAYAAANGWDLSTIGPKTKELISQTESKLAQQGFKFTTEEIEKINRNAKTFTLTARAENEHKFKQQKDALAANGRKVIWPENGGPPDWGAYIKLHQNAQYPGNEAEGLAYSQSQIAWAEKMAENGVAQKQLRTAEERAVQQEINDGKPLTLERIQELAPNATPEKQQQMLRWKSTAEKPPKDIVDNFEVMRGLDRDMESVWLGEKKQGTDETLTKEDVDDYIHKAMADGYMTLATGHQYLEKNAKGFELPPEQTQAVKDAMKDAESSIVKVKTSEESYVKLIADTTKEVEATLTGREINEGIKTKEAVDAAVAERKRADAAEKQESYKKLHWVDDAVRRYIKDYTKKNDTYPMRYDILKQAEMLTASAGIGAMTEPSSGIVGPPSNNFDIPPDTFPAEKWNELSEKQRKDITQIWYEGDEKKKAEVLRRLSGS